MQKCMQIGLKIIISLLILVMISPRAFAAKILKSNAKQAIIQLDELEFSVTQNDQVVVMNNSKRVGILKITKITDGKAKADILKGSAPVGGTVIAVGGAAGKTGDIGTNTSTRKLRVGGVLGYFLDSQTTTLTQGSNSYSVSQSGTGYSGKGFAELAISGNLWFQGRFGISTFNVAGTAPAPVCTGPSTNCNTSIMYVSGDALIKYNFPLKSFTPFGQIGLGLFYPVTKSSTALDSIPAISVFLIDLGADIKLSGGAFIPVYFEYGYFPPSTQVSTNFMGLVVGYGKNF
jgi:hypothetical protein